MNKKVTRTGRKYTKVVTGEVFQTFEILSDGRSICLEQKFEQRDSDKPLIEMDGKIINKLSEIKVKKEISPTIYIDNNDCGIGRELKIGDNSFVCPECGNTSLECVEFGNYCSEVTVVNEEGDFEYGPISADGDVERFQCCQCGKTIGRAWDDVVDFIKNGNSFIGDDFDDEDDDE